MDKSFLINVREKLKVILSNKRYLHSLGTEEKAAQLAEEFGVGAYKARLAGLLHDNAKYMSKEEIKKFIEEKKIPIPDNNNYPLSILHVYAGEYLAKYEYGVTDNEVLSAIRNHAIGTKDMSKLDKIIFIADKIEENTRNYDCVNVIRETLDSTKSLDHTMLVIYAQTLTYLINKRYFISPQTIVNWNYLLQKLHPDQSEKLT